VTEFWKVVPRVSAPIRR